MEISLKIIIYISSHIIKFMLLSAGIMYNLFRGKFLSTATGPQNVDCYTLNSMKISPEKNEQAQ